MSHVYFYFSVSTFEVERWGQGLIPLLSWHPSAACQAVCHWPERSPSGLNGRGEYTLSGSGPCLSPALERPEAHFPEILVYSKQRICFIYRNTTVCEQSVLKKFLFHWTELTFLFAYPRNAELTCRSFIHKVQFVVEVGQFRVLLFQSESNEVEQRHLSVCRLSVQQLCGNRNEGNIRKSTAQINTGAYFCAEWLSEQFKNVSKFD